MLLTIDASVFVASVQKGEPQHADSRAFLDAVRAVPVAIACPTLILTECAASAARRTGRVELARLNIERVAGFPSMTLVPLTEARARQAAELAALHKLRGADSVYVAVAQEFGATLVTWDAEMLARAPSAVTVQTPADYLTAQPGNNTL